MPTPSRTDTENLQVGKTTVVTNDGNPKSPGIIQPDHVALQDEVPPMDQMELEKFMNEELLVLIHEPQTDGEPTVVPLEVGGIPFHAPRGIPIHIKRKYVEILARARNAKVDHYYKQQGEDIRNFQKFSSRSLTYPFVVDKDPSGGKGRAWLARTLADTA